MIRHILLLFALLGVLAVFAQQNSQYSHYVVNYFSENPCVAGSTDCVDFKTGGRYQWLGMEGAPSSIFASIHGPLRSSRKPQKRGKHGLGVYIERDRMHVITETYIKLAYAYHVRMSRGLTGAAGMFVGMKQYAIDNVTSDPAVGGSAMQYPDLMPGVMLYNKKMYLGLAIEHLTPGRIKATANSRFKNQYYFSGGYRFPGGGNYTIFQSFNFKFNFMGPPSLDLTQLWEHKKISLGAGYRVGEAAYFLMKLRVLKTFNLAYAFDFPLNKLRTGYATSHEIILGLSKCRSDIGGLPPIDACPAYR